MSSIDPQSLVEVSLVIEHDGKVLLARRSQTKDHAAGTWEAICGRLEPGESLSEAARREALEETGLTVEVLEPLDSFHFFRGKAREEVSGITFHCRVVSGQVQLSEEHDSFAWAALAQAHNYDLPAGLLRCISRVLKGVQ